MRQTIDTYIRQSERFLENADESIPVEVALSAAGPDLREAHIYQRKRLQKRNINLWIEEFGIENNELSWENQTGYIPVVTGISNIVDHFADGIQYVEYYKKHTKGIRRYIHQNGTVNEIRKSICREYYVKDKMGEAKEVLSVDVAGKIHGLYRRNTEFFPEERFAKKVSGEDSALYFMVPFCGLIASFILITFLGMIASSFANPNVFWFSPILLTMGGVVASMRIRKKHMNRRNASREVLGRIRAKYSDFSTENFISMAAGRLKCICYAEDMQELESFVNADLSDFLATHRDVVNCDQIDFFFNNFVVNDQWLYIEAEMDILLDRDCMSRIKQQKETVKVKFIKPADSIMATDFYHDWYVTGVEVLK